MMSANVVTAGPAYAHGLLSGGVDHLLATTRIRRDGPEVLGALAAALPYCETDRLRKAVRNAAKRTAKRCERERITSPGLHSGRSGAVWALLDAATVLNDPDLLVRSAHLAAKIPVASDNPDVCDGSAGAGLALLHAWRVTGDREFLVRARTCARQQSVSMNDYGLGHGLAGIAVFLLDYALASGDVRYLEAAMSAADALCAAAMWDRSTVRWPSGPSQRVPQGSWHGDAAGVGSFLVRLWLATGDDRYHDVAQAAAAAVRADRWTMSTVSCHGVIESMDFLLDMADATSDGRHREWALRTVAADGRLAEPDRNGLAVLVRLAVPGSPRLLMPPLYGKRLPDNNVPQAL